MASTARPILPVADLDEAARFYEQLGFSVTCYDGGYAWVVDGGRELFHLQVVADLDTATNPAAAYFHVSDADEWHARWRDGPGDPSDLADRPWGMREFSLRDPSGNLIRVGHNR